MSSPAIKVLTFDLDDTLWAVQPVLIKADQQVYQWLSQQAPRLTDRFSPSQLTEHRSDYYQQRPDLAHQISQLRQAALQQLLQFVGYKPQQAEQLAQQAFEVFIAARHQVTLFETVIPMLSELQQHYRLGVLTNGNADVFRLPIGRFFDFAVTAEQLNASKPAADHFLAAQAFCHCRAEEIIHIGDHLQHDIHAAQQAGCRSIWYNPANQPLSDSVKPDQQVQCLSELPATIAQLQTQLNPESGA